MDAVRIGVVGLGNMGSGHVKYLANNEVPNGVLTAVTDVVPERLEWARKTLGEGVHTFSDVTEMFASGTIDAVIIAVPHYDHPAIAIQAFEHGLHVLTEKPAGVYTKQVREMNEAAQKSGKVFGIMFNQRTNPLYQKVRELVQAGELGEFKRLVWIITDWYRSQSYYNSGGWRATWAGEGGGVLLNQAPHQLDLWPWILGTMPTRVRAFCAFGKYHDIEVEDDVTAYAEYENGGTALFVTTTGETPGTNRLEVSGDRGKIVVEDGKLSFWRLRVPERQFNQEYQGGFGEPECWNVEVPVRGNNAGHKGITINWVSAICNGTPLLAPGIDGIHGVELANAMLLSTWTDGWVNLPIDDDAYYERLQEQIAKSRGKKEGGISKTLNVEGTH